MNAQERGAFLRAIREQAGLTVHEMGKKVGYDGSSLSRTERGVIGLTPDTLRAYEQIAGYPLDLEVTSKSRKEPHKAEVERVIHERYRFKVPSRIVELEQCPLEEAVHAEDDVFNYGWIDEVWRCTIEVEGIEKPYTFYVGIPTTRFHFF